MSENLKSLIDRRWPNQTPASEALVTIINLISLIMLINWGTNYLRFPHLRNEFTPVTPATALCLFILSAVLLCQQQRSINNIKPGDAYEVEYHVHAARRKNKLSFISMARWEGIR